MPIEELADDHLVQRCASCAAANTVPSASLAAGVAGVLVDPRIVALPACAACGAQEFLVRSLATDPEPAAPGGYSYLHRLLVDHLHAVLVSKGQTLKGAPAAPPGKLADDATLKRWLPTGLKLAMPSAVTPGAGTR